MGAMQGVALLALVLVLGWAEGAELLTKDDLVSGTLWDNAKGIFTALFDWDGFEALLKQVGDTGVLARLYAQNKGSNVLFKYMNFVDGFDDGGWWNWLLGTGSKWNRPVKGEKVGVVTYQEYAKTHFGKAFPQEFFDRYYTGGRVPSWEDNGNHAKGVNLLKRGMQAARAVGVEPMEAIHAMEPRFAFDEAGLVEGTWNGFDYMGPYDVKYASNGVHGMRVVDRLLGSHATRDTLGVMVTESVFGAHLTYAAERDEYVLDLNWLARYRPIAGYAGLGGRATFRHNGRRLETTRIELANGTGFAPGAWEGPVAEGFRRSELRGWVYAEKALIASLLSMTNLVMHVKDLHLELAAATQAVTIDAFAANPGHPVRRMLDPFIHRSIQATNDNLRLLFDYRAAEFSLAPLPMEEQLRLIDDAIREKPLNLAEMDMEHYGRVRGMPAEVSGKGGFWRWHYRALTVQRLFSEMAECWVGANYGSAAEVAADAELQAWWGAMVRHLPALRRATEQSPEWAGATATRDGLVRVVRTLMVWLSWIHEDVGHSAAAYVYNPVHTPMSVPEDGRGVPVASFGFNVAAYRGFVFLERATLLDDAPGFWFRSDKADRKCFETFQARLRDLGRSDPAFSECDQDGFYSCVDRVETAVSS